MTRRDSIVLVTAGVGAAMVGTGCRARPVTTGEPGLGRTVYEKKSGRLSVALHEWTRDGKNEGTIVIARAPAFEVVPADRPQKDLTFANVVPPVGASGIEGARPSTDFAALNGGFYDESGTPMGIVRHQGRTLNRVRKGGGSGVMLQTPSGPTLIHRDTELPPSSTEALQSIDRLVVDGKSVVSAKARPARDARSAVAVARDGVVLVALYANAAQQKRSDETGPEGRTMHVALTQASSTTGVSLGEFASLLARPKADGGLGVKSALNLDGGYSVGFLARIGGDTIRIDPFMATINAVRLRA